MKSSKRILILITGILIALILILFSNQDLTSSIGAGETEKPKLAAPALPIKVINLFSQLK